LAGEVMGEMKKLTLYPIYDVAQQWDDEPFDFRLLPFQLCDSLSIRDVSPLLDEHETFGIVELALSPEDVKKMRNMHYAIVHEYEDAKDYVSSSQTETPDQRSEILTRNAAACLTIIRPMRQAAMLAQGTLSENGYLILNHFEHPIALETPMLHRLFHLRMSDAEDLRELLPTFLEAYSNNIVKFKMAVEFYWTGHHTYQFWKPRFLLWVSALEAIYTSQSNEHKGKLVATERIKFFLGENTPIYNQRDLPVATKLPHYEVGDIVEHIYNIRNCIAHGERIPDEYFSKFGRTHLGGEAVSSIDVLFESLNFMVRATLIKIMRQKMLSEFRDGDSASAYFKSFGLVNSELQSKRDKASRVDGIERSGVL
jgi:hypothetical protein